MNQTEWTALHAQNEIISDISALAKAHKSLISISQLSSCCHMEKLVQPLGHSPIKMQLPQIAQKEPWRVEVKGEIGDTNSHVMDFAGMQLRYRNTLIDTNDFMTAQKNPDDDDDLHKKQVEKEIYFFNCLHH